MQPIGGKKAITLCILRILTDYSDFDHPLTYADIIKKLKDEYGVEAARNAVGRNISLLLEMGYDISTHEENNRGTYLNERDFDDTELMTLIDAVLSSAYIPEGDAKHLIEKLGQLSNAHFRMRIPDVYTLKEFYHQRNRDFFYNMEMAAEAIQAKKQLAFTYNRMQPDGRLGPERSSKDRVHPYAIVCTNSQYYLIASYRDYDNLRHYRIDRMTDIEISDRPARPINEISGCRNGLNIGRYAAEHKFMYGGDVVNIVLKVDAAHINEITDAFGERAKIEALDDDFVKVSLKAGLNGMRFWALQYGNFCEVLEPEELRKQIKKDLKEMVKKYEER